MASIEDQTLEMKELATRLNLNIVLEINESKSAKAPGREGFQQVLDAISRKEADAIICWKLNRLARNPIDGGQITYMLQNGELKTIQTYSQRYRPEDNIIPMMVEFGMATQYVKDLSTDVKRGMRRKAERGWFPSPILPLGYSHADPKDYKSTGEEIIIDTERFEIISKVWAKLLQGESNFVKLKEYGDRIGLTHRNGCRPALNTYRKMLVNTFYHGEFTWREADGNLKKYKGKHQAMITKNDYFKAQQILGLAKAPQRTRTYYFPYKALLSCGTCSGPITAEHKLQAICTSCKSKFSIKTSSNCPRCDTSLHEMNNPSIIDKTYYRCTKNHGYCPEKSITPESIESQLRKEIKKITINYDFVKWALQTIKSENLEDHSQQETQRLVEKKKQIEKKIEGLVNLRLNEEISNDLFQKMNADLENKLNDTEDKILCLKSPKSFFEHLTSFLLKNVELCKTFDSADENGKIDLFREVGSNLTLRSKKLYFSTRITHDSLKECEIRYHKEIRAFEPRKTITNKGDFVASERLISSLRAVCNLIRTHELGGLRNDEVDRAA
jgi:DNA invertase Pin-like site-specific DNA recombinase